MNKCSSGQVKFEAEAQGEGNIPWGFSCSGRSYVTDTDTPAQALLGLMPFLREDVFEQLERDVYNEIRGVSER